MGESNNPPIQTDDQSTHSQSSNSKIPSSVTSSTKETSPESSKRPIRTQRSFKSRKKSSGAPSNKKSECVDASDSAATTDKSPRSLSAAARLSTVNNIVVQKLSVVMGGNSTK